MWAGTYYGSSDIGCVLALYNCAARGAIHDQTPVKKLFFSFRVASGFRCFISCHGFYFLIANILEGVQFDAFYITNDVIYVWVK